MIQTHVQTGYDIVKGVNFPWPIAQIILQHHERLDGSGYPQGLKGDAMLPEAKILAVADVVEAMMSHRPYRQALGVDAALAEIEKHKGRLYDPAAVDACVALFRGKEFEFDRVAPASVSGAPAPRAIRFCTLGASSSLSWLASPRLCLSPQGLRSTRPQSRNHLRV